jgi:filamentous hemagglutinin
MRVILHTLASGLIAKAQGGSAIGGAAGGLAAGVMSSSDKLSQMFFGKSVSELSEDEKMLVANIVTLAGAVAGGAVDGRVDVVSGASAGRTEVENNYLSDKQKTQREKELEECQGQICLVQVGVKWTAISLGQDGSFAAGMIAGVPVSLYDTIKSVVKTASSPVETYEALKTLFNSDDLLGNIADAVKQSYIERIDQLVMEYQKAGASGSFNAGVEGGKLVADIAGLLAGGGGIAKVTGSVTEKIVAKVAGHAELIAAKASNEAHNAAKYAALKLDLKTTEAANDLVDSLRNTGKLPDNYVNKSQAIENGWKAGKALNNTSPGKQIGGDIFENSNNLLPSVQGRVWREADIGIDNTMSRGNQAGTRLLYSDDGLLYITTDHYETATSIGKWK